MTPYAFEMVIRATRQRLADRRARDHLSLRAGRSKLRPFTVGSDHLRLILARGPTRLSIAGAALALVRAVAIGMIVLDMPAFDPRYSPTRNCSVPHLCSPAHQPIMHATRARPRPRRSTHQVEP